VSRDKYTTLALKSGSRTLAILYGDELRKVVSGSKHFLHKPLAICVDKGALDRAEAAGCKRIRITDDETGIVYRCSLEHFKRAGSLLNRGFGLQVMLPLDSFQVERPGQPVQLTLFGEASR